MNLDVTTAKTGAQHDEEKTETLVGPLVPLQGSFFFFFFEILA